MTREQIYNTWAPPDAPWSDWAKPILFAHLPTAPDASAGPLAEAVLPPVPWPAADGSTALVLDLPGAASVHLALAAARAGYRPVPLYNACPAPVHVYGPPSHVVNNPFIPTARPRPMVAVDLRPLLAALADAAPELHALGLPYAAPPAFLLDARRRFGDPGYNGYPGTFDNRSVSLPTDFPSANLLLHRGLRRAVVITETNAAPQEDLAHTLLRWQRAGISLESLTLQPTGRAPTLQPLRVARPNLFRIAWYSLLATAGFRRNPLGGFGGFLPEPSNG